MLLTKHTLNSHKTLDLKSMLPTKDISSVEYVEYYYTSTGIGISLFDKYKRPIQIASLPDKEKIYVTESSALYSSTITTNCYNNAKSTISNIFPDIDIGDIAMLPYDQFTDIKRQIDEQYRQELCKLGTSDLELVIKCHEKGKIRRADVTLQAMRDELARRYLLQGESTNEEDNSILQPDIPF